jgi:Uma2 family endonuclease
MGASAVEQRATEQKSVIRGAVARSMVEHAQFAPISVEQYHQMLELGVLPEGSPIELLNGMLVWKNRATAGEDPMTIGKPHTVACTNLILLNSQLIPLNAHIRSQNPVTLPAMHEPEPDGAIVAGNDTRRYLTHHPEPAEIHCIIEVSDSSLEYDRGDKLQAYAKSAIPQYVIVNLIEKQIEIYQQPIADGRYSDKKVVPPGKLMQLACGSGKAIEISTDSILP